MTGRRCLLPVAPYPKMALFCAAQWPNFAPPLTRVDQMEADMLRTRMCYE